MPTKEPKEGEDISLPVAIILVVVAVLVSWGVMCIANTYLFDGT